MVSLPAPFTIRHLPFTVQIPKEKTDPKPLSESVTRTVSSIVVSPSRTFFMALILSVLIPIFTASRFRSAAEAPLWI